MKGIRLNETLIKSLGNVLFMPSADMIKETHIATTTWYNFISKPSVITIQQLLSIANGLHIPVRRLFSVGGTDVIGHREDYVTDPYIPCYYDGERLQNVVSVRSDATWQKASEIIGMTPTRLRNSLLGETRTPAVRFLKVCELFGVNPFSILIDPNPAKSSRRKTSSVSGNLPAEVNKTSDIRSDIAKLHKKIDELNVVVSQLQSKYEALLKAHDNLVSRVNMNVETFNNNGYIGIAAERRMDEK